MQSKSLGWMITLFLVALYLAACQPKQPTVWVKMSDFKFSPSYWKAPAGGEVTIVAENHGNVEHEWMLMKRNYLASAPFDEADQQNVLWQVRLGRQQKGEYSFTAPTEPGEYQIICSLPGHLELGMTGILIVEASGGEHLAQQ
jgi:plastocyanin